MLKSDTSSRDFSGNRHTCDRTRQLGADLESLARACLIWSDDMAGCEFSPTTTLHSGARIKYWSRFLRAYGCRHSPDAPPRLSVERGLPDASRRSISQTSINVDRDIRDR